MLYYAITIYYTILYYTILYYTILYYTILYYTILYYTILYYTILYHTNLLLAECEVRTASYGPSFFLHFMAQARSARAMKTRKDKTILILFISFEDKGTTVSPPPATPPTGSVFYPRDSKKRKKYFIPQY